jgi:hypothetical protein
MFINHLIVIAVTDAMGLEKSLQVNGLLVRKSWSVDSRKHGKQVIIDNVELG